MLGSVSHSYMSPGIVYSALSPIPDLSMQQQSVEGENEGDSSLPVHHFAPQI